MKPSLLLLLALGSITVGCTAAPASVPKVLLAQADTSKIAQVKAGILKTANASWWGFDKVDATYCLQNAINSGVPKLIVDNTGSDWIVNKSINLASNQQIIFAEGVVIQAKKDCFKGKMDSLFSGKKLTHIALIGQGKAVLRMHRDDYANPALYEKAEWRHGVGLWDCSDVVLRGLTVTETGGDGLYLGASSSGFNKNVLVEDCNFDANYRQGISVISAEDLTIRNCKLTNTSGTAPQAGIDYEPNNAGQRLVNCVLENCVMSGNKGGGLDIYAVNLNGTSPPISITINNCSFSKNSVGVASTITRSATNPANAIITLNDCKFDHERINLRNTLAGSAQYQFKNCTLDFVSPEKATATSWKNIPIMLTADSTLQDAAIGGVHFDHTTIKMNADGPPLKINFQGRAQLSDDITGSLYLESEGKNTKYDLASFVQQTQAYLKEINQQKPAVISLDKLQASATDAVRTTNNQFYLRNDFTFLQYAEKDETIAINVTAKKVYARETTVDLIGPDGKKIQTYTIPVNGKPFPITFTATETGLYRVVRNQGFSQRIDITSANHGNGLLAEGPIEFLPLSGKLYFQVPAGVESFTIGISTDSTADVALLDPNGKEIERHNNLNSMQLFSATRTDATKSEIWSIDVSKAVWAVTVNMYAPLVPVVSTNPGTLLLK